LYLRLVLPPTRGSPFPFPRARRRRRSMNTFADAAGIAGRQFEAPVLLKEGTRLLEPDVYRTLVKGRVAVVKDYSRYRRTPLAPLARLLVRREARALGRLRGWAHAPMLLGIVGGLALAMEFVPGEPLGAQRRVSEDTFRQLRGAVAHLHANGITHNDLHPANVMV